MELALLVYFIEVLTANAAMIPIALCILIFWAILKFVAFPQMEDAHEKAQGKMDSWIPSGTHTITVGGTFLGDAGDTFRVRIIAPDGEIFITDSKGEYRKGYTRISNAIFTACPELKPLKAKPFKEPFNLKFLLIPALCLMAYASVIPNRDTAVKMVSAYAVQEVATNVKVQEVAGNSLKVVEKFMGDYLEEVESTQVAPQEVIPATESLSDEDLELLKQVKERLRNEVIKQLENN